MTPEPPLRVLVVDDDRAMRQSLVELLEAAGWRVMDVSRAERVLPSLATFEADVILSDVRMPGMTGLELLRSLKPEIDVPVVLISAHGDIPIAVEAMQDGAYSFVEKPYEPRRLLSILSHAAEQTRMRASNARLKARLVALSGLDRILIGETQVVEALRSDIQALAETPAPILLKGETGTGKDLVARALHDIGPLADRPFVSVNCALLSPDRFATEMFGAAEGPDGKIVQSDGGTLFLDEVCACPLEVQAQFLRVLEDNMVTPEGTSTALPVSLRVISATNEDIEAAVAAGRFREDLYFRLNTFALSLPPLRDRKDDLRPLLAHFLFELAQVYSVEPPELTPEDMAAALAYDWPGNVRELRSVAARRLLSARTGGGSLAEAIAPGGDVAPLPDALRVAVAALEREMIGRAIVSNDGRMDDAAEALGIGRRTLNEKIVKLGLDKNALL